MELEGSRGYYCISVTSNTEILLKFTGKPLLSSYIESVPLFALR